MNRLRYRNKFNPATATMCAVSEISRRAVKNSGGGGKSRSAVLAAVLAALPAAAHAACPTPTATHALVQDGDTCSYDQAAFTDPTAAAAVIQIQGGGTATFTAPAVELHKTYVNSGGTPRAYAAIYLRDEAAGTHNTAVFAGNVEIKATPNRVYPRDVAVGGGGILDIKGDLTIDHLAAGGALLDLGHDNDWNPNNRDDGRMTVGGNFTGTTQNSNFIRLGGGTYTFEGKTNIQATNDGRISVQKQNGRLYFRGDTTANINGAFVFMQNSSSNNQIEFGNLELKSGRTDTVFSLEAAAAGGNRLTLNGNTVLNAPGAKAAELYGGTELVNKGTYIANTADGIAVHSQAAAGTTATFTNSGTVHQNDGVARHHGQGLFQVANSGVLRADNADTVANVADGRIELSNQAKGLLIGSLDAGAGELVLESAADSVWKASADRTSVLSELKMQGGRVEFADNDRDGTINADRYSGSGGTIVMNTVWNDDAAGPDGKTVSNVLKIGDLDTGAEPTTVLLHSRSIGNITPKAADVFSDDVITVSGTHQTAAAGGNAFVGTAYTDGAQMVQLVRNGNNYRWTLRAGSRNILAPAAAAYLQSRRLGMDLGLQHIGMLHQRVGSRYQNGDGVMAKAGGDWWGRAAGGHTKLQDRDRFGSHGRTSLLQIGRDIGTSDNGNRSGLMLAYSHGDYRLYDKYRAVSGVVSADKYTGNLKTDAVSFGMYHTRYAQSGAYLDLVGQLTWLKHRHSAGAQRGYALAVSAEAGKPYALGSGWQIEPQAQLVYQYQHLRGLHDGQRQVHGSGDHRLHTRFGSRLIWRNDGSDVYLLANISRTFGRTAVRLGDDRLTQDGGRWKAELGIGGQIQAAPALNFYADARYLRSLGGGNRVWRDSSAAEAGAMLRAGMRYRW